KLDLRLTIKCSSFEVSPSHASLENSLIGISDASRGKMSGVHNPLIMEEKLVAGFQVEGQRGSGFGAKATRNCVWMRNLSVFIPNRSLWVLTLNNIRTDRKELKMLTKGRCMRTFLIRRRHDETFYYCSWPSRREGVRC